jgi:hypothetical protein
VRHSAVATLGTTWLRLAEGTKGWAALPRLAAWLCVPALLAATAPGISQAVVSSVSTEHPLARALVGSAGNITMLFGTMGILTTTLAAVLILILCLLRRWRIRVIGILWLPVIVAMGITFPAMDTAMRNWTILRGAPRALNWEPPNNELQVRTRPAQAMEPRR